MKNCAVAELGSDVRAMATPFTTARMAGYSHAGVASEVRPTALCGNRPPGLDTTTFRSRPWSAASRIGDGTRVELGGRHHPVRLDVRMLLMPRLVLAFDDQVGVRERRVHIAALDVAFREHVQAAAMRHAADDLADASDCTLGPTGAALRRRLLIRRERRESDGAGLLLVGYDRPGGTETSLGVVQQAQRRHTDREEETAT